MQSSEVTQKYSNELNENRLGDMNLGPWFTYKRSKSLTKFT